MIRLEKYLAIRERFFRQFYFSGRIAEWISADNREAGFADQTIYMGQALIVFAAEAAQGFLPPLGAMTPIDCIRELLAGIEELEHRAAERYGSSVEGLFVRDDITGINDPRLKQRFSSVKSDWQDASADDSDSPSQDQLVGLLLGLRAVVEFVDDGAIRAQAKEVSMRLFRYVQRSYFILKLPNGKPTSRGSDARGISSLLHGLNSSITGIDLFHECFIEIGGELSPLNVVAAFWDSSLTPVILVPLIGLELPGPAGEPISLHSYALHLLLMSIATSRVWSQLELEAVSKPANHELAAWLYCALNHTLPQDLAFSKQAIELLLSRCPESGPSAALSTSTGWHKDNRWIRCTNLLQPTEGDLQFNGIDWLALAAILNLME